MKRILSILMSMALVVILLVSMSVTSFAAPTEGTAADGITVEYTIEEYDKEAFGEFFAEADVTFEDALDGEGLSIDDVYVWQITATVTGLDLYNDITGDKSSNRVVEGRYIRIFDTIYYLPSDAGIFSEWDVGSNAFNNLVAWQETNTEFTTVGSKAVVKSTDDVEWLDGTYDLYETTFKTYPVTINAAYPYKTSDIEVEEEFKQTIYIATTVDTFTMLTDNTIEIYAAEPDTKYNATIESGQPNYYKWRNATDSINYVNDYEEEHEGHYTLFVKEGQFVSKDEYYGSSAPATHNITVYANGEEIMNETIAEGEAITMPTAPAVTGKTFSHWATTEGGSAVEPATQMGTEDLTYYAVYETNKYTITYIIDGREETKTVEHGQPTDYTGATPTKEGYDFTGWDKDFAPATADTTYTAQFAIKTYTITFIVNGATTTKTVNHGETPDFGSVPEKDGYNFTGWSLTENGPVIEGGIPAATGAATYYAVFEEKAAVQYTITFKVDGQADVVLTVNAGTMPVFPGTPSKEGYRFTGWNTPIVEATADATYIAQFEEIGDAISNVNVVNIVTTHEDILPGAGVVEVTAYTEAGKEVTVKADELLRVHTTFDYNSENGILVEMGMLFVPVNVIGEGKSMDEVVASGKTKDANCSDIPMITTGSNTGITFKAGLVGVPKKGIKIYAVPYYRISDSERTYHDMQTITFE